MTAAPALKSRLKYKLKIVAGPHLNEIYSLDRDVTRIGRGEENEIKLINDGRVSRNHAEIIWTGSEFKFKNLSQKNYVLLDGQVLVEGALTPSHKLQIGESVFEVFEEGPILVSTTSAAPPQALKPTAPPVSLASSTPMSVNSQSPKVVSTSAQQMSAVQAAAAASMGKTKPSSKPKFKAPQDTGKRNFYIGFLVLGGLVAWLIFSDSKPKVTKTFRTSQQVEYDLLQSSSERKKLEERLQGQQTETAKRAQENLIKGFRDYQQGNYARARDNFQVVLNLDPDNEIAKRYYHLARIKFDELLQFNILQGLRYRDKRNYRMCRSSFQAALVMIQNNANHPKYREIKNFFDECNLAIEGRF